MQKIKPSLSGRVVAHYNRGSYDDLQKGRAGMLILNNEEVHQVLTMRDCMEALEEGQREVYARDATARPRIDVWAPCDVPEAYYIWGSMEGTSKRWRVFALRLKSDITFFTQLGEGVWTKEWYCREPGTFCGLIFLFSLKNGEPLAIVNDGVIQHMRVGARAGLMARRLARSDATTVGMIGSGGMARVHAMAFKEVRPIKRIQVYSPTKAHRDAYAEEMAHLLDLKVAPVDRPEDAVRGAQIVACCTDSIVPVLGAWLDEGAYISTVRAPELHDSVVARLDAAVGSPPDPAREPVSGPNGQNMGVRAYVAGRPEELDRIPPAYQAKPPAHDVRWISGRELAEGVVTGRLNDREIILGGGIGGGGGGRDDGPSQGTAFAAVGGLVYHLARERGLGREIPTDWFLQDIRN